MELSRVILENLPIPVIGVSAENMIVLTNKEVQSLGRNGHRIELGRGLGDFFSTDVEEKTTEALQSKTPMEIERFSLFGKDFNIELMPLKGRFQGQGVIMALKSIE